MEATELATAVALAVLVGAGGVALVWRRADRLLRGVREELDEARAALRARDRAAAEERAVQDLILSSMRDGVLLVADDGEVVYANDASERHLGGRPSSSNELFPLALREGVDAARRERIASSALVEVGVPTRSLRVQTTPVGDDGSVLVVVRDVTEARRLEDVRRDFVANASHELKTPAASIQAAAETLRQVVEDDPSAAPRFAAQLERDAVRLSRIVGDLLDLSRLEAGSELEESVHLDALVREEARRFEDQAGAAEVDLVVREPTRAVVRGSARDLSLLVRNLVDNAIRYTRPRGSVEVALEDRDGRAVLVVRDTGVGIPQRDLGRVFERFYRVDRARSRETGGTGLGLAIVRHVAENHGGEVRVESELGTGTTIEVSLPRDPEEADG